MPRITLFSALYPDFRPFDSLLSVKHRCFTVDHPSVLNIGKQDPGRSLLLFWGGQDIHPSLYKEGRGALSGAGGKISERDHIEVGLYQKAVELGIPVLGICRGAQLMCALNGGKLVQHVVGHTADHHITTNTGGRILVTSTHHQMMLPKGDFELLAWSSEKRSSVYFGAGRTQIEECHEEAFKEPEIVFYPKTKTLAVQGHPEYMKADEAFPQYVFQLLKEKLNVPS